MLFFTTRTAFVKGGSDVGVMSVHYGALSRNSWSRPLFCHFALAINQTQHIMDRLMNDANDVVSQDY